MPRLRYGQGCQLWAATMLALLVGAMCDEPFIDRLVPCNAPTQGGSLVTLIGNSFGADAKGLSIRVGGNMCTETVLVSQHKAICEVPPGLGDDHKVVLSALQGTSMISSASGPLAKFSYDAPTVQTVDPGNGPCVGGTQVTVQGSNFGVSQSNPHPEVTIGGRNCLQSVWESNSKIKCVVPPGLGIGNVVVFLQGLHSQSGFDTIYEYDGPKVSGLRPDHGPTAGGSHITLFGENFGPQNSHPTAVIGYTPCQSTSWTSDSSVACELPQGSGILHRVGITVIGSSSKPEGAPYFSYDAPVVTSARPANAPPTDSVTITMFGQNFGSSGLSELKAFVGATQCLQSKWVNPTSVECSTPAGTGNGLALTVMIGSSAPRRIKSGQGEASFGYDAPIVRTVSPTLSPTSGGLLMTIQGDNFGAGSPPFECSVGGTPCSSSRHESNTIARCGIPAGVGTHRIVVVTVDGQHSEASVEAVELNRYQAELDYEPPSVHSVIPSAGKPEGGSMVTVSGSNFGTDKEKVSMSIGQTQCRVLHVAETSISALAPAGEGRHPLHVVVGGQSDAGKNQVNYAFDGPSLTSVSPANGPTIGGTVSTIFGTNLGAPEAQISIRIDGIPCLSHAWVSETSITCTVPPGTGGSLSVTAEFDGTVQARSPPGHGFTYDAPRIESVDPSSGPLNGGDSVMILGRNFGMADSQPLLFIGNTKCASSRWVSDAEAVCQAPKASRNEVVPVRMSVDGLMSSDSVSYYYGTGSAPPGHSSSNGPQPTSAPAPELQPQIFSLAPDHAPPRGGQEVTIIGSNFEQGQPTQGPEASLGDEGCARTRFVSTTAIACLVPEGVGGGKEPIIRMPNGQVAAAGSGVRFSYDEPLVLSVRPSSGSLMGGEQVTISGRHFGSPEHHAEAFIGRTKCMASTWIDRSSISCLTPKGDGTQLPVQVSVGGQRGHTRSTRFSFVGRVIDSVSPDHAPAQGNTKIDLGIRTMVRGDFLVVSVGGQRCISSGFNSDTDIWCTVPAGVGKDLDINVVADEFTWRSFGSFSYNAPLVRDVSPSFGPAIGGIPVTVMGQNFGNADYDPTVKIGQSSCQSTFFQSDSSLLCMVPAGGGSSKSVSVEVGGQSGMLSNLFDFEVPTVVSVDPSTATAAGGVLITIHGDGFGAADTHPVAFVGPHKCDTTSWVSDHIVTCVVPTTMDTFHKIPVQVDVCNQSSIMASQNALFEYTDAEWQEPPGQGYRNAPQRPHGTFYLTVAYSLAAAFAVATVLIGKFIFAKSETRPSAPSLYTGYSMDHHRADGSADNPHSRQGLFSRIKSKVSGAVFGNRDGTSVDYSVIAAVEMDGDEDTLDSQELRQIV